MHKRYYKLYHKHLNIYQLQKHITKLKKLDKYKFWKSVNSQTIQDITERINNSYSQFFRKIKQKLRTRPPKFQKVKKYKSITFKNSGYKFLLDNKLSIQGKTFKYVNSRNFTGEIKTLLIKRTVSGLYLYVIFDRSKNVNKPTKSKLGKITGIDVGLKTFLTFSNTDKEESPEFLKSNLKLIRKLHRNLSRKQKGSNHREQAKIKLVKAYEYVSNKRTNYLFELADQLTQEYAYIFIEDLDIEEWKQKYGRKTSDISISKFFNILKHQGLKNNCLVHKIDKYFPSSKTCSNCGYVHNDLKLSERTWICPICKTKHDRDINAAINIKREGMSSLNREGISSLRLDNINLFFKSNCYSNLESPLL